VEIELADAVAVLRDELVAAAARGAGQQVRFTVGPVELEFDVELREDSGVKAGFRAWVVTAEGGVGSSAARTQRVKVTLTPHHADGSDVDVRGGAGRAEGPGDVSGVVEP
jgi:hypothetical protein